MKIKPILLYDDENPDGRELPTKLVICESCEGKGTSSAYLGAFTRDDFEEEGPEFVEDYLSGAYDRACDECRGTGRVCVVDADAMSAEDRAAYQEQREDDYADQAMRAAELRMGA